MKNDLISRQAAIDMIRLYREDEAVDLDELESSIAMMPSAQPEGKTYEDGWREGREALRREIWEDGRDRLD